MTDTNGDGFIKLDDIGRTVYWDEVSLQKVIAESPYDVVQGWKSWIDEYNDSTSNVSFDIMPGRVINHNLNTSSTIISAFIDKGSTSGIVKR